MEVAIIVPIAFFATVFGIVYVLRSARHREKMAMIENGIDESMLENPNRNKHKSLKYGIIGVSIGLGLIIGNVVDWMGIFDEEIIYFATVSLSGGIGQLAYYKRIKRIELEEKYYD